MRICQQGPNRGRSYWACANRAEACRRCFLWSDGRKNLTAPKANSNGHSGGDTGPDGAGSALVAVSPASSRGPSMLERLQKRGREVAVTQDMTAEGVAARELRAALQARSDAIRSKSHSSGSSR